MNIYENKLVSNFLSQSDNRMLLEKYQIEKLDDIKRELDDRFKVFYQKYRLISYLIKLLHFESKHLDKKHRQYSKRFFVAIEQTIEIELNVESGPNTPYEFIPKAIDFQEHISDFVLFNSFNRLTVNQKRILTLFYLFKLGRIYPP